MLFYTNINFFLQKKNFFECFNKTKTILLQKRDFTDIN